MKPEVDQARLRAAAEAAGAGDLATAAEGFAALAAEHPEDDTIACNLGAVLQALGRDDEAIAAYRRAAAVDGDAAAMSQYNLGTVLAARGDTDGALAAYRAALARAPELAQAHGNIGALHYAVGDYAAAEAALVRAVELAPDNAWARRNLGAVLCALGSTGRRGRLLSPGDRARPRQSRRLHRLRRRAVASGQGRRGAGHVSHRG